jgi:deferrochelatase/peroxidase EfeB
MDQRPVSEPGGSRPNWKLAPPHDTLTQGLVVSGFGALPTGRALFLEFGWKGVKRDGGGEWLAALAAVAPVTDADRRDPRAAAMGFTWLGLRKMGLDEHALASFDRPFQEGMFQEDRLRRLGDRRDGKWQGTVVPGGPHWSGNTPLDAAAEDDEARAFDDTEHDVERRVKTPLTVHAMLLIYTEDEAGAESWCKEIGDLLEPHQVTIVRTRPLQLRPDAAGIAREHFGFADGISQPLPFEPGVVVYGEERQDAPQDHWNGVPLGEILMGHTNAHHEVALGPVVADSKKGQAAGLQPHPKGEGFLDLGLDGSYMVVRELKQDVVAFWESMRAAARHIRERDPDGSGHVTTTWLAERVVGRDTHGNLLCPMGTLSVNDNGFGFFDRDRHGAGCPMGSHVRRANPRDGLAPDASQRQTMLNAANSHRILRRGRKYGTTISVPPKEDGVDRGLLFICLNTDITRQFEFIQQTWLLNPNFATLYDETDPLVGPKGKMTIREEPLRRIMDVDTFVQMAGGEYFFLPSMPAIRYLAAL